MLTHKLLPVSFLSFADDVLLLGVLVALLSVVLESLLFVSLVLPFVSLSLEKNKMEKKKLSTKLTRLRVYSVDRALVTKTVPSIANDQKEKTNS